MHEILRRCSDWLFCGSWGLFALSWILPIDPDWSFPFSGAIVFFLAPFGAFIALACFLYEGFDPQALLMACLLSLVTVMNGFFVLIPLLRDTLKERAGFVSVTLGLAILAFVLLVEAATEWPSPFQFRLGSFAWLTSFALMSASCAASHFAQSSISSSKSVSDHD